MRSQCINFFIIIFPNKETFKRVDENQDSWSVSCGKSSCSGKRTSTIIFTLKNEVGGLVKALKLFQVCLFLEVLKA